MRGAQLIGMIILFLALAAIVSLKSQRHRKIKYSYIETYGKSYNPFRVKHNIPIIENDWMVQYYDSTYVFWSNRSRKENPAHISKTIGFQNKVVVFEEDDFYYETRTGIIYKLICRKSYATDTVTYFFAKNFKNTNPATPSIPMDVQSADSVLGKWGFARFYSK